MIKKLLFFILFFLFNINVNADTIDYWGYDLEHFTQGYFYDCLNSNSCSSEISTVPLYGVDDSNVYYPGFLSTYTYLGDYGNQFDFALNQTLLVDYLYSLTIYMCNMSTSNAPNYVGGYGGTSLDAVNAHTYPIDLYVGVNNTKLSNYPYFSNINENDPTAYYEGLYCRATTMVFSPTSKTTRFGYQFNTSSITSAAFWAVGYEITELGYTGNLTKSDISSVINNSDLATASSIDDVNDELVTIQSEISGMQEKQDVTNEKLDETNQQLSDLNSNLNDSDTSDATNEADNFFSGFETNTFGLTSIITAPLNLIGNITSSSCSSVGLPLPYVDKTLNLPCLSSIYQQYFGSFLTIYQTITFGIVAYWVCIRIFALVKDFKNPDHDEIEVLDL